MKVLKSMLLVFTGLFTTVLLHAQEIKTSALKREENKLPPAPAAPAPTPVTVFIPMNGIAPKTSPELETETPSPYNKDKNNKPVNTITDERVIKLSTASYPKLEKGETLVQPTSVIGRN